MGHTVQAYQVVVALRRQDGTPADEYSEIALADQLAAAGVPVSGIRVRQDGMLLATVGAGGATANAAVLAAVRQVEAVAGEWLAVDGAEVADLSAR